MISPKPTLFPYLDLSDPSAEEFGRLRTEMHEAVWDALPQDVRDEMGTQFPWTFNLVSMQDLEPILDRVFTTVSNYENGKDKIPPSIMRLMRLLHKQVTENPDPAVDAILKWWKLIKKEREAREATT